ncbi:MAG TPA: hypothetical protein VNK95_03370, partial [Caldilineaceae bacterium]|nr:hypothetical protein [Caldilineaceae bacterium]
GFVMPIPVCPECITSALPNQWESVINLAMPVPFKAMIVDSHGDTVAKTRVSSVSQILNFKPAPFAKSRFVGASVAGEQAGSDDSTVPAADELRYYLIIEPVPGTDLSQPYDLSLSLAEGVAAPEPIPLFLPAVRAR